MDKEVIISSSKLESRNKLRGTEKTVQIYIGADFVQTKSNLNEFVSSDWEALFGYELFHELMEADIRIFNLEIPFASGDEKILKAGSPNLKADPKSVNLYKNLAPIILSGANNHILDYSKEGLNETLEILDRNSIEHVGFGSTCKSAREVLYKELYGIRIGIFACAENEFAIANEKSGGANGYDEFTTYNDIHYAKKNCDYLIVLYHGGRENYRYPSIRLKKVCEKIADSGADLVACQHSHCIGAFEIWNEKTIVYGQGNFLFDYNDMEEWKTSILLKIRLNKNNAVVSIVPLEKYNCGVRIAELKFHEIVNLFYERSERILDSEFLKAEWVKFCRQQSNILLLKGVMGINNKYILAMNKHIFHNKLERILFGNRNRKALLLNYLRCESIRESILTLLEDDQKNS